MGCSQCRQPFSADTLHSPCLLGAGNRILLADGSLSIEVLEILSKRELKGRVLNSKSLGERKNCNLPGMVPASMSLITTVCSKKNGSCLAQRHTYCKCVTVTQPIHRAGSNCAAADGYWLREFGTSIAVYWCAGYPVPALVRYAGTGGHAHLC